MRLPLKAIVGVATTSGKSGSSRRIDATATPANDNCGNLRLWFTTKDKKMVFEPAYHFLEKEMASALVQPFQTNRASNLQTELPKSP